MEFERHQDCLGRRLCGILNASSEDKVRRDAAMSPEVILFPFTNPLAIFSLLTPPLQGKVIRGLIVETRSRPPFSSPPLALAPPHRSPLYRLPYFPPIDTLHPPNRTLQLPIPPVLPSLRQRRLLKPIILNALPQATTVVLILHSCKLASDYRICQ